MEYEIIEIFCPNSYIFSNNETVFVPQKKRLINFWISPQTFVTFSSFEIFITTRYI